jgi:GNAT superfamily N-acetyltransferase
LWVSPGWRRSGVGFQFFSLVLDRLQAAGVRTVFLWVLDGNEVATRLYRKAGFDAVGKPVPLTARRAAASSCSGWTWPAAGGG